MTLTAPGHTPKINTHWSYAVHATAQGKPVAARITAQIVDPIGGAHPVQFGKTTKTIVNWPFKGEFRDFIIWPASSRGIPLKLRITVVVAGREEGRHLRGDAARVSAGAAIAVSGVRKSFEDGRVPALRDVSFAVEPGELVALTGASGSGKSTLLNLIGALDTPDAGSIVVDGDAARRAREPCRVSRGDGRLRLPGPQPPADADGGRERADADVRRLPDASDETRATSSSREVGLERPGSTRGRRCSRAASASASRSPARLRTSRGSCSPTSRPARSTPSPAVRCSSCWTRLRRQRGMTIVLVTNDESVAAHADRTLRLRDGVIRAEAPRPASA